MTKTSTALLLLALASLLRHPFNFWGVFNAWISHAQRY